jgi:putative (di)nucleoside polyphosphate hydrolase
VLSPSDYRAGVGIVLVNSCGLVFSGRRRDNRDHPWQMPQGGLQEGETPRQAALREVQEELGTDAVSILEFRPDWLYYDYPAPESSRRATLFRGQRHLWYLLRFEGSDSDIEIDGAAGEFSEWRWNSPAQIIDEAVSFKQPAYRQVMRYFAPSLMALSSGRPSGLTTRIAAARRRHQITA